MIDWRKVGTSLRKGLIPLAVCLAALVIAGAVSARNRDNIRVQQADYPRHVQPLLQTYCHQCHNRQKHKGGFSLDSFPTLEQVRADRKTWTELLRKLRTQEMPPEDEAQPSDKERQFLVTWIDSLLFPVDCDHPDPGRVTIRRLNRAEYNNTVRDLLGVDFKPADDFPHDDTGYGFDHIGDVLSLSPLLLEKYFTAAESIMDRVFTNTELKSRVLVCAPTASTTNACLRQIVEKFARRAYRRPVTGAETGRLVALARVWLDQGEPFDTAVKWTCQAVLVSPGFLFRAESQPGPDDPKQVHSLDEFSLASRLSYFLWSSMPDEELFSLAERGRLRKELPKQLQRMLKDPRSEALVQNFAGQWLQFRNLKNMAPDRGVFPAFDDELRESMRQETELFFANLLHGDRSVMDLLVADYTFVNDRLARHYGLKEPGTGAKFQQVSLKGTRRAGVLTQGSVLLVTSNPTRTSPVKRGKWVLENLLAQPPPPPPPNVPPLKESKEDAAGASLRERMVQHRADPLCSSCHAQMDPIGFSLENFDGIGAWRDKDGGFPIDASGQLPGREQFVGPDGLARLLAGKRREQFLRCVAEKMLTYALGRGLEYYDRCAIDRIVSQMEKRGDRFSALVEAVVTSTPFQMRRGEGDPHAASG
jgi:hypothetical protein